jgi:hypothetical protein
MHQTLAYSIHKINITEQIGPDILIVASIPYSSQYIYQPDKNINKET